MKLGIQINNFSWTGGPARSGATLAEIARNAEDCGFDRIGVADHLWQHPIMGGPEAEELECYTTLAYLAANTSRVNLTAIVTGVHFRHPGVLAKTVSTLDVLSGGRAAFGIGAGHYEEEARGLGGPLPSAQRALRDARGDGADSLEDVERRRAPLRGKALPARATAQRSTEP